MGHALVRMCGRINPCEYLRNALKLEEKNRCTRGNVEKLGSHYWPVGIGVDVLHLETRQSLAFLESRQMCGQREILKSYHCCDKGQNQTSHRLHLEFLRKYDCSLVSGGCDRESGVSSDVAI